MFTLFFEKRSQFHSNLQLSMLFEEVFTQTAQFLVKSVFSVGVGVFDKTIKLQNERIKASLEFRSLFYLSF